MKADLVGFGSDDPFQVIEPRLLGSDGRGDGEALASVESVAVVATKDSAATSTSPFGGVQWKLQDVWGQMKKFD
ncbi:MAG TPA: hypothetical protein VEK33_21305 [Terriglobales bacterium]|nr:hypothetical protein [Terriglobales bacterium]